VYDITDPHGTDRVATRQGHFVHDWGYTWHRSRSDTEYLPHAVNQRRKITARSAARSLRERQLASWQMAFRHDNQRGPTMSLPVGSEWRIERESANTQTITITQSTAPTFTAKYVDLPENDSEFSGEIQTREATVLDLRQHGKKTRYTAFHVGTRQGDKDEYVGSWHDVAHGFSGKFRLVRTS
jgi:hypothetical protein